MKKGNLICIFLSMHFKKFIAALFVILLLVLILAGCATHEGETVDTYFYQSEVCTLGMSHTYGERFKGKNTCFKHFRIEFNEEYFLGDPIEPKIEYRLKIDPDFLVVD